MEELIVNDQKIRVKDGYFSLTDIAKNLSNRVPSNVIRDWLNRLNTLKYLQSWEKHNNSNNAQMRVIRINEIGNDRNFTAAKYQELGGTGLFASAGRYGGTYAHVEIAFEFATWLNPEFKVLFFKEWVRMKEEQIGMRNLEWHLEMLGRNAQEIQNLLQSLEETSGIIKPKINKEKS